MCGLSKEDVDLGLLKQIIFLLVKEKLLLLQYKVFEFPYFNGRDVLEWLHG